MIEINLLPVREARLKADFRQQIMQLVLVVILAAAAIGYVQSRIDSQISETQRRIVQMEADVKQFKPQLDQVAAFRKKKASLEKKIDVIDGLDRARKGPVRVLNELATYTPERLWLTNLSTSGTQIQLKGESLDNELVAVLLHAMGESPYFANVDLDSTQLGKGGDGLKLVTFQLHADMVTPKPAKSNDKDETKDKAKDKAKAKGGGKGADVAVTG